MLKLYIDDGVEGRSHRQKMVDPNFRYTGIAHCKSDRIAVVYSENKNSNGVSPGKPTPINPSVRPNAKKIELIALEAINKIRMKPKAVAKQIKDFYNGAPNIKPTYKEAYKTLLTLAPTHPVKWSEGLSKAASDQCSEPGYNIK
jgi:uncharacterized protein YkwD